MLWLFGQRFDNLGTVLFHFLVALNNADRKEMKSKELNIEAVIYVWTLSLQEHNTEPSQFALTVGQCMVLFSRRRWRLVSAQQIVKQIWLPCPLLFRHFIKTTAYLWADTICYLSHSKVNCCLFKMGHF